MAGCLPLAAQRSTASRTPAATGWRGVVAAIYSYAIPRREPLLAGLADDSSRFDGPEMAGSASLKPVDGQD